MFFKYLFVLAALIVVWFPLESLAEQPQLKQGIKYYNELEFTKARRVFEAYL